MYYIVRYFYERAFNLCKTSDFFAFSVDVFFQKNIKNTPFTSFLRIALIYEIAISII